MESYFSVWSGCPAKQDLNLYVPKEVLYLGHPNKMALAVWSLCFLCSVQLQQILVVLQFYKSGKKNVSNTYPSSFLIEHKNLTPG